jgi:putative component of membrane protein insertase Oxa1/YidC/SpoIIIJ protein YidD
VEELIKELGILQNIMNQKPEDKIKVIEAYNWFVSKRGKDCTYAKKCSKLFTETMYKDIRDQLLVIQRIIEGIDRRG